MSFLSRTTALTAVTLVTVGAGIALATSPVPPTTEVTPSVRPVHPIIQVDPPAPEGHNLETHVFNGSSTDVAAFQAWFAGEDFVQPEVTTRDIRPLELPNGEVAELGDSIVKYADGSFGILAQ